MKDPQETTTREGDSLVTTTRRELSPYEFFCDSCNKLHTMAAYAIAQLSSGNPMVFTCSCGTKIPLKPFKK
jgi:RNase P subunit RPR2